LDMTIKNREPGGEGLTVTLTKISFERTLCIGMYFVRNVIF